MNDPRYSALIELSRAIATTPYNASRVRDAVEEVTRQGGKELAVEATSTAACFMAITKVADATCKKPVVDVPGVSI